MAHLVDQYWIVDWDLRDQTGHTQHNLPAPNMHLVIDHHRAYICTTISRSYQYDMRNQDRIIGIKFQPGVLAPVLCERGLPLLDSCLYAEEVFPQLAENDCHRIRTLQSDEAIVLALETMLPKLHLSPEAKSIRNIVAQARMAEPDCRLEELASACQIHPRRLQRLCKAYLGLSPKALVQKFRLQKAIDQLDDGIKSPSKVALDLGFSDQAHLNREIKKHSNKTPREISTNR